jgi:hypothetical protein
VRVVLFVAVFGIVGLTACGGGSSHMSFPITVALSPIAGQSLSAGASLNITANVNNDESSQGVIWSLSGDGLLINQGPYSVTYVAPSIVPATTYAVVSATSVASSNASAYVPVTALPLGAFANVQPVNVDGGPVVGKIYPNGAFTSVTICTPGTLTCTTVDGVLIDTGSSGLRVLASAMPSLPALNDSNGNNVHECIQSSDQSYVWGKVALADVRIGGEVARSVSIQAIADPASFSIPSDSSSHGAGIDEDTQLALGANGILGVGLEPQDCGVACDPSAGGMPPGPAYYACTTTSCSPTFVSLAQQVTHPALFFAKDNNGVALQFSPLSGAIATLSGLMTFGIGTQTNNTLGSATLFTVDAHDNFTTNLAGVGQSLTASFIDSGSNGLLFPDSVLQACPNPEPVFFCPASLTPMSANNVGVNNAQSTIDFSVDNAENLLTNNPTDAAFSTLAGSSGTGACLAGTGACSFDWGLPFFYGRTVFTSIRGQTVPSGAPAAPWWAYTTGFSRQ